MPNPSYDYQQNVLANLPSDILFNVNGKDGLFTFNNQKYPTYLEALYAKWYLTANGYVEPSDPEFIPKTDGIAGSAHSFLAFAMEQNGDGGTNLLQERWDGNVFVNYLGFSTLKQRWDANGVDRTGDYNGALWLTEFTNPQEGWPAWDSAANIETLQYLYNYAVVAQNKGCKAIYIYPPWSPEGLDLDAVTSARAESWRYWLQSKVTIPVYIMPIPYIVNGFRQQYDPQSIYSDGLHLRSPIDPAPNQFYLALALGIEYMMTRVLPDVSGYSTEVQADFDVVKFMCESIQSAGLGGTEVIEPDNTTDPLVFPESLLFLTDPTRFSSTNLIESALTPSSVQFNKNDISGNSLARYPIPPEGSRVRFNITTTSGNWWWRVGNTNLGNQVNIWNSNVPVTNVSIDFIVTADHVARGGWMGLLTNSSISSCSITNFRVTPN